MPVVYPNIEAAQREIADDVMEKLQHFLDGQRDFDDAMTVEDYILPVLVLPDGSVLDEDGNCFGKKTGDDFNKANDAHGAAWPICFPAWIPTALKMPTAALVSCGLGDTTLHGNSRSSC